MIGNQKAPRAGVAVGDVFPLALDPKSFHGQLAQAAPHLFCDADFAACYHERLGRPSVPPSQLALLTLLQQEAGCSDEEAVARSAYDLRWTTVLGHPPGEPLCAKSTLQLFRTHLILHDAVRAVFQKSIQEARRAGLLKGSSLRIAVDTKPILGRGAVQDTYNLLGTSIRHLVTTLAAQVGQEPEVWAQAHDLGRYFPGRHGSVKGGADLDWSDPVQKQQFLLEIVTDARRLWRLAHDRLRTLAAPAAAPIREAQRLLGQLLLQDVVESTDCEGVPQVELKEGVTPGRLPSATDPEQRHGRKSKSKRFTGHKASVAVDKASQIIVDGEVLAGDAPDATGLKEQVERVEENTALPVADTSGDCAYGSGETRQAFADAQRTLLAKVPQEGTNGGLFPKSAFVLELPVHQVTCPGGQTTEKFTQEKQGGKVFHFGAVCQACPLRAQCTESLQGRTVRVHPQEALLQTARAHQATPEGRVALRARVGVEHRLARLGQLGIGQARYVGRQKTRFQLLLACTVANLRRTWNWAQAAAGSGRLWGRWRGRWGAFWELLQAIRQGFTPHGGTGKAGRTGLLPVPAGALAG